MVKVVSRSGWDARASKGKVQITLPTPRLWVHHTGAEQHGAQGVRDIQRYHQDTKRWKDIAYSFLIDDDGTIYEGRGAGLAGGHTEGDNSKSHAICLMGNFDVRSPTIEAMESLVWLARHGAELDWWYPTLGGHRDAPGASTACPGRHLYNLLPTVRRRVAAPPQEEDVDEATLRKVVREELTKLVDDIAAASGQKAHEEINEGYTIPKSVIRRESRVLARLGAEDAVAPAKDASGDDPAVPAGKLRTYLDGRFDEVVEMLTPEPVESPVPPVG